MKLRFIGAIAGKLDSEAKKKEMLNAVKANKEEIAKTIQTIKLSNKLIRKLAKELKKLFKKFKKDRELSAKMKCFLSSIRRKNH